MKHLDEDSLAAYGGGESPTPADAAHLKACRACRDELSALRGLARSLAEAPAPPRALRRATLERLGLEAPRARPFASAPRWAGVLAGVAALAWLLPLPRPWERHAGPASPAATAAPAPRTSAPGSVTLAEARPARHAHRRGPGLEGPARAHGTAEEIEVAQGVAASGPGPRAPQLSETQSTLQAPAAVGAAPDESSTATSKGPEVPLGPGTPDTALSVESIRGNLLRPGQGQALGFTVALGQAGPLRAVVLDGRGALAATLYSGEAGPGSLDLSWDGGTAPSGAYTVLVQAGGTVKTFHVLVIR